MDKALVTIIWKDGEITIPEEMEAHIERDGTTCKYPLPEPTAYNITTSTLVDSGTSVSGKMLGAVVRSDVAQISVSWNYMEASIWANINQMFLNDFSRTIRFFDQTKNCFDEREMSVSDRSAGMWRREPDSGKVLGWTGCSLQFTEV